MCSLYLVVYVIVLFVYVLFVVRLLCFFFSCLRNCHRSTLFFFLMIRRPPRSTRMTHSFPTRRSSDLGSIPGAGRNDFIDNAQPSRSAQAAQPHLAGWEGCAGLCKPGLVRCWRPDHRGRRHPPRPCWRSRPRHSNDPLYLGHLRKPEGLSPQP